ncbi:flagellar assembly protein FliW [Aneurinibacillus aneurinilyticus]|uniref:Flagellar assembly factor FliW n=1 Tax=Aneurinibacillus aneurinilyticus TaxID=1391 RepID=A0A848D1D5_ANEAE|nr:flagellar assembly protein FliW [Aneurinibacillus aneurinilyticus]NMF00560.1 flagellar assembly protein FliW [Aneurinibacillus aneurinilyticus]
MILKMESDLFGTLEYEATEVYTFEQGIPGFPNEREFLLVQVQDSPFTVLHSLQGNLYFFLIDPFRFFADYEFALPDYVLDQLEIKNRENVLSYSIVVLRDPLHDSTVNLVAPIVLNTTNRKGMQLVLEKTNYSVRQPIFSDKETTVSRQGQTAEQGR